MRHNLKKIVSVFLTVCMLLGTMAMIIPVTAGAEQTYPIVLEKNKTATVNGVTYRFDVSEEHMETSWAQVNADGTWEFNISHGDMLWFPDIELTSDSQIRATVTKMGSSPCNFFTGFAYGVKSNAANSAYEKASVAVLKTSARLRATPASRANLMGHSGSDHGNGGDSPRAFDKNYSFTDAWNSIIHENGNWNGGKTIYFDVKKSGDNVVIEFGAEGKGAITDPAGTTYSASANPTMPYEGGAVGYTVVWAGGDDQLHAKFDDIVITNCKVAGEAKASYSVKAVEAAEPDAPAEYPIYLEKNKTATINGITYRFDTDETQNPDSWARLNADGTWEISYRFGDTLWFPDVELTSTSKIHFQMTNTDDLYIDKNIGGLAYGITADSTGRYENEMVAMVLNGGRTRIGRASYAGNNDLAGGGLGGNGGFDKLNSFDTQYVNTWQNNSVWKSIAPVNKCVAVGKSVTFDVEKLENGNISVAYGSQGTTFVTRTYNQSTSFENNTSETRPFEGGAVGYSSTYTYSGVSDYAQIRIDALDVVNCKVDGADVASYSLCAVPADAPVFATIDIVPNADNWINGQNYRLETTNADSYAKIKDGKLILKLNVGDVFWIPTLTVKDTSSAFTFENITTDTANARLSILTHVKSGENMYGIAICNSAQWVGYRYAWSGNGIATSTYDVNYTSTTWGGTSTPNGSTHNGSWSTSECLSVRTTYETWSALVPRTYFYENVENLDERTSNKDSDVNFRWYPSLSDCAGTSFGLTMASGTATFTIDKITATNMNGATSYVENFDIQASEPEESNVINIVPNADNWINGHNYRLETSNAESYAKIEDGKLILKISSGDLFWIPTLTAKDTSSAFTFENITTDKDNARLSILTHVKSGENMYGIAICNASQWVGYRYKWNGNGVATAAYDVNYTSNTTWGGTSTPNGSTHNGSWSTSESLSVRTTYENWSVLVPRTYFYENVESLDNRTSNKDSDVNFRWYPSLTTCVGTSFGLTMASGTATFTIDKITATNMNETASYVETFDSIAAPGVSDAQVSLSLDGTIGLNFKFNAVALQGANVIVTKNGEVIDTKAIVEGENVVTAPVNAKEMGDDINFSIKLGGEVYDEQSYTTSVKAYATAILADSAYAEWHDLIRAMLNYGAAAQKVLNYKTNALVADISNLDYDMSAIGKIAISGDTSKISALFATLTLESDTSLNIYVMPKEGETVTATVNGAAATVTATADGFYRVTVAKLAADELSTEYVVVLNEAASITISATEWAKITVDGEESAEMKTLAKALAAYSAAADAKIDKAVVSFDGQVATAADIAALRLETDKRIEEIKNTANLTPTTSTVIYVSSSTGNDSNSGTSPDAPIKTLSKANSKMTAGCTVCLKRGDIWRGEGLVAKKNVTITAYGDGAKPLIMGSHENGGGSANTSKWTDMGNNIWRYEGSNSWSDVGNIVFNDGESYATKIVQLYVKQESWSTYQITDYTNAPAQKYTFKSYTDLRNDLDFFHDKNFSGGSGATGYLYMYSTSNPALRFDSIEFAPDIKLVEADVDGVTVDNICFKYTGGHAVAGSAHNFLKTQIKNLTVQNCEFYWIGGSVHERISNSTIGTDAVEYDTRYGNAIEIYGGCDGFIARNNYIYQVFDAGITIQLTMSSGSTRYDQKNIQFVDNVIEYCNYSIEYFLTKIPSSNSSSMTNFEISGNYMWNAGYGFCETRMIWGRGFAAHIKSQFTSPCNRATGFEITDNIMVGAKDGFLQIRNSFGEDSMPLFENNELYGYYDFDGKAANGFRIGEVRVKSEDTQDWVSYDTNTDAYLAENMGSKYGEGNKYYFIF